MLSVTLEIPMATYLQWRSWLLGREQDIAIDIEDLGELKAIFEAVMGRKASGAW